ncbi:hypothetical protein C7Y69_14560 [Alteromonas sp. KS69]|jgi:hypothetical protein|uniref:hypothetical protein n=1 Tax=Alteromonas sp. KS69 TaxID=2109917 RepID=UPI000F88011C|nr:hypothetical protein [Alteromonas sp. KS69]RUP78562.1 hypothetical protein C7Y69_14560 [Alteromonas sp. KS69]
MDYSNKWLVGLATLPATAVSVTLLGQFGFWGLLASFVIFIVVTNIYLSVVATAEKSHRLIRLSAFFLAPFAFFVVAMYV